MTQNQKRISIMANSGGVGKTTLAVNLGYQLHKLGKTVALFGCDPNGSLTLFCGLDDPPTDDQTLDYVLRPEFSGDYPLFPVWTEKVKGVDCCLGGLVLNRTSTRLVNQPRGDYMLADHLEDYPLSHDFVIFDCPGTIEKMHSVSLAASTDIILTLKPEDKDVDAVAKAITWIYDQARVLRLQPAPKIAGLLPNGFKDRAMHRDNLGLSKGDRTNLYDIMAHFGIPVFPVIKDQAHIANAGANGLPLGLFRPGESANQVYEQVARVLMES